jgi:hypothetical protein
LISAALTLRKRDARRRRALLRFCRKHLDRRPEFAYYLSIGTVPQSLSLYEE